MAALPLFPNPNLDPLLLTTYSDAAEPGLVAAPLSLRKTETEIRRARRLTLLPDFSNTLEDRRGSWVLVLAEERVDIIEMRKSGGLRSLFMEV